MPLAIAKRGGIRGNNTTVARDESGRTVCTRYDTHIAVLSPDGAVVVLNTGGYNTPTTLRRMNECLHAWGFDIRVRKADFAERHARAFHIDGIAP